jgi:hypothetical protein
MFKVQNPPAARGRAADRAPHESWRWAARIRDARTAPLEENYCRRQIDFTEFVFFYA